MSPTTWTESKRLILTGKKPVALKQRPLISTVLLHRSLLLLALLLLCICKALVPGEAYCNAYGEDEETDQGLFWELERSSGFGAAAPVKERVLCECLIKFPKPWAACFWVCTFILLWSHALLSSICWRKRGNFEPVYMYIWIGSPGVMHWNCEWGWNKQLEENTDQQDILPKYSSWSWVSELSLARHCSSVVPWPN